jgi:hypothetical protein
MSDSPGDSPSRARADAAFAIAMIAVALLTMWGVRNQPKAPYDPVGAAAVPFWTATAVFVLAAILLVRVLLRHSTRGDSMSLFTASEAIDDSYAVAPRLSVYSILVSILYVAAIPVIGFMSASVIYMCVLGWLLGDRTPRSLAVVAAVAVVCGVGLDLGFRALLIDLP